MAKKDSDSGKSSKSKKYAEIAAKEAEAEGIAALDRNDPRAWRFSQLIKVGYDPKNARKLADRYSGPDRVDLQEARDLLESGCPPETAVKILS